MRYLYTVAIAILLSFTAKGQFMIISNFTGTSFYGSLGVTVTSMGSVSTGGGSCLGAPLEYWAGQTGPGAYIYTVSAPVYRIRVHTWGINGGPLGSGEYCQMYINGAIYALTPADVTSYTECLPGGGPMYISAGRWMGPVGLTSNYNGGDYIISVCTGISSFELWCNGSLSGVAYHVEVDTVRPPACVHAVNNSPCIGDTLKLDMEGDSTGATYSWTGPGGFTSTLQNPFIYPSTFPDSGLYHVIRYAGVVNDTDSTYVVIHPKPVVNVTNNSPLCSNITSTLQLGVTPDSTGETFLWVGPPISGFTSTLQNPNFTTFVAADTGNYWVYATTQYGCKDTGHTHVSVVDPPPTPTVSDMNYCQGEIFVPFTLGGIIPGDTVLWYTTPTGGFSSTIAITVNTAVPGMYHVWVSQKLGQCESGRGTDSVRVTTTPPAPVVTGPMQYCQFIGPIVTLTVTTTPSGVARWYTMATGGSFTLAQPYINVNAAGVHNYWVSQIDSGCEGPRTPVTITIHPKPAPPIITQTPWCQFRTPGPVSGVPSGTGDQLLWYGPGVTAGSIVAPTPGTFVAPDTIKYYVTETTIYGCVSDSTLDVVVIKVKPPIPVTKDISYCQHDIAKPLNWLADSIATSHLNWYYHGTSLNPTPIPVTDTLPGTYTWYVSQTVPNNVTGCEGDSASVSVRIVYKPVFGIQVSSPFVCQFDSIKLSYCCGPTLFAPGYLWTLPAGAIAVAHTSIYDSSIMVQFDSANQNNYVILRASDDSNFCAGYDTVRIKVVKQPDMATYTKPDVCLGDTVQLGLANISPDAFAYYWYIDSVPMSSSTAIRMISHNSHSGGPYTISWVDSGKHVITITSTTIEGCKSMPAYDSVNVHTMPDASFIILGVDSLSKFGDKFCLEDSVQFSANKINYRYSYEWSPAHYFDNLNTPVIFGKMESENSLITLKVTDPFGCYATTSQLIKPATCCAVTFPDAFTPNGDGKNDVFRPIFPGGSFHRFHKFQIVNRWGALMFDGGNSNTSWDGTLNGVPQDMGVYFYYIKYDCGGATVETKGDVTLIR